MSRLFLEICNKYHKHKLFWLNITILNTPREEEVARETLRRSTRPRSKPAVLRMDTSPPNKKKNLRGHPLRLLDLCVRIRQEAAACILLSRPVTLWNNYPKLYNSSNNSNVRSLRICVKGSPHQPRQFNPSQSNNPTQPNTARTKKINANGTSMADEQKKNEKGTCENEKTITTHATNRRWAC